MTIEVFPGRWPHTRDIQRVMKENETNSRVIARVWIEPHSEGLVVQRVTSIQDLLISNYSLARCQTFRYNFKATHLTHLDGENRHTLKDVQPVSREMC